MKVERITEIAAALRQGQWIPDGVGIVGAAAHLLIRSIGALANPLTLEEARNAAAVLNKHLCFSLTFELTNAWRTHQRFDASMRKHQAQALINLGGLDDAEELIVGALHTLDARRPANAEEQAQKARETPELRGLFARVAKDRFVRLREVRPPGDPESCDLLKDALKRYDDEYRRDPSLYWHGINAVTLQARLNRELSLAPTADFIARVHDLIALLEPQVADTERTLGDAGAPWVLATLSEAYLALGAHCSQAESWLRRLLRHPLTKPFPLAAYARQLREIWQGDALRPEQDCASRLASLLLIHQRETTGTLTLSTFQLEDLRKVDTAYEKSFSNAVGFSFAPIADACDSIGCVCSATGRRVGTGFLIDRRSLWPDGPQELVFVTNAHVISETHSSALRPGQAFISFEMEARAEHKPSKHYPVVEVLFSSEPGQVGVRLNQYEMLDITIVRLGGLPAQARSLQIERKLPPLTEPAYVIGHPSGRDLEISTRESQLLDVDHLPRLFHYRTPTERGSSGSPVFNENWQVIGVHHAGRDQVRRLSGDGFHDTNEGVALDALLRKLAGAPPPRPTGDGAAGPA